MPTTLKPPVSPVVQTSAVSETQPVVSTKARRPKCVTEYDQDGTLVITFTVSPEMAKRFERNLSPGHDMADYVYNNRGLRYFEQQPII